MKEGAKRVWILEAQGFSPQGRVEYLFSKAKVLGKREKVGLTKRAGFDGQRKGEGA